MLVMSVIMRAGEIEWKESFLLGSAFIQSFVAVNLGVSSAHLILITYYHSKACRYLQSGRARSDRP